MFRLEVTDERSTTGRVHYIECESVDALARELEEQTNLSRAEAEESAGLLEHGVETLGFEVAETDRVVTVTRAPAGAVV